LGAPAEDPESPGDPRVDYDVPHGKPWGADMVAYLFMKAVSTGAMLVGAILWLLGFSGTLTTVVAPAISAIFIALTAAVLVIDLERPERFYYILTRANWRSWLVWGSWFLTGHGALSAIWLVAGWFGWTGLIATLAWPTIVVALAATAYTGFLFAQGLGRDLWQGPHAALDLIAQSGVSGAAALLFFARPNGDDQEIVLLVALGGSLLLHLAILFFENILAPSPSKHHELAVRTIRQGHYAPLFWGLCIAAGGVLPLVGVLASFSLRFSLPFGPIALIGVLALLGSAAWEYIWVEAGQSVPLS
jgi:hypothetical protein